MALGDLVYRGADLWLRLVGNTTTTPKFLRQTGTGSVSAAPSWQAISLSADVTGDLPFSGLVQASGASKLVGRGSAGGAGDFQEITLGTGIVMTGTVLSASGAGSVRAVGITIDGGASVITTGVKGFVSVPFTGTITAVTTLSTDAAVTSGSIVIDIWKDTYAAYPPTVADTITASAKPTITTATKSTDAVLTGWTTAITAGDVLAFKVDSVTSLKRVTLVLTVTT